MTTSDSPAPKIWG